jgi:hypothetical protein
MIVCVAIATFARRRRGALLRRPSGVREFSKVEKTSHTGEIGVAATGAAAIFSTALNASAECTRSSRPRRRF